MKKSLSRQFPTFLITAGVAALVNLASRYFLNLYISFELSVFLAYCVGVVVAYTLAKYFVFVSRNEDLGLEFLRFIIVNVISLAIVWTVSVSLRNIIFPGFEMDFYPETVSHIIGVASPAIFSFFAHKTYTFNER